MSWLLFTHEQVYVICWCWRTSWSAAGRDVSLDALGVTQGEEGNCETLSDFDRLRLQFSSWYWSSCSSRGFVLVVPLMLKICICFDTIQVWHKCFKTASRSPERLSSDRELTVHRLSQYFQIFSISRILKQCRSVRYFISDQSDWKAVGWIAREFGTNMFCAQMITYLLWESPDHVSVEPCCRAVQTWGLLFVL